VQLALDIIDASSICIIYDERWPRHPWNRVSGHVSK
jgi:hypothetical protein